LLPGQHTITFALLAMNSISLLSTSHGRERLVAAALNLAANTALAPDDYERQLLSDFVQGMRSIDEVEELLDRRLKLTI
jgi:hypothetical protein